MLRHRMVYSYLKPESVRVHPEATVRPWATCQIVGDALTLASALGYMYVPQCTCGFGVRTDIRY